MIRCNAAHIVCYMFCVVQTTAAIYDAPCFSVAIEFANHILFQFPIFKSILFDMAPGRLGKDYAQIRELYRKANVFFTTFLF